MTKIIEMRECWKPGHSTPLYGLDLKTMFEQKISGKMNLN